MLENFAIHYESKTGNAFDVKGRYIRYAPPSVTVLVDLGTDP